MTLPPPVAGTRARAIKFGLKAAFFGLFLAKKIGLLLELFNNPVSRAFGFITTKDQVLLLSGGNDEIFVVSSSDKEIGLSVYSRQQPYDFKKFDQVMSILGGTHKRKLLIDIGGNIGTICIPAVKRGYFESAITFEPEPQNFDLLSANIHLNHLASKITAHQIALSNQLNKTLSFELSAFNLGDHRIRVKSDQGIFDEENRKVIEIKSTTFDSMFDNIIADETLIWIDTQGYEGQVLSAAKNALAKRTPICLEFGPYYINRCNGYDLLKLALLENGYEWYFDLNDGAIRKNLTSTAFDELYARYKPVGMYTDILVL